MKLNRSSKFVGNQGSVLLVAVGTVVVLGIILAAILALITQERRVLARTSSWNSALPAAEAGIEEAMSHLRQVQDGPRGVNEWQQSGSSFVKTRYLSAAGDSRYTVGIDSSTPPVILSVGEVFCPNANTWIQRRVEVTTTNRGLFHKAMVAKRRIAMSGSLLVDSFDSSNDALSTNGQYDPAKRSDQAGVASNSSEPGAITLQGGVQVYGTVATGPTGTVSIANNSTIGSETWVDGGSKGIQPGVYAADMNLSFESATIPYQGGTTPAAGSVNGTNYTYVLTDGDYYLSTLQLKSGETLYVSGKARLVVDKDISGADERAIQIATNATLELYLKRGAVSLTGKGVFNKGGKAADLSLTCLDAVTEISISGNGGFLGTIYAPNTTLKLSGGGTDILDFVGAVIVGEVNARGNYKFHYDEALAKKQPTYFYITSWQEI
ncbi:MAG TPA: hypothetical protein VFZ59_15985 [Verrucomicrobiae bacterium]|nr:hypothetical protein [Verrucomicrobiae bacterium]